MTLSKKLKCYGACIYTESQEYVVGGPHVKSYCPQFAIIYKPTLLFTRIRFSDGNYRSLGTLNIRIPTNNGSYLSMILKVVKLDMLFSLE